MTRALDVPGEMGLGSKAAGSEPSSPVEGMDSAMGIFLLGEGEPLQPCSASGEGVLDPSDPPQGSPLLQPSPSSPEVGLVPLGMLPAGSVLPPLPRTLALWGGYL